MVGRSGSETGLGTVVEVGECAVKRVRVYEDGAEVRRSLPKIKVERGMNQLLLTNFPSALDAQSVRLDIKKAGNLVIKGMSVDSMAQTKVKETGARKIYKDLKTMRKERASKELTLRGVEESRAALLTMCGIPGQGLAKARNFAPVPPDPKTPLPSSSIKTAPTADALPAVASALDKELKRLAAEEMAAKTDLLKAENKLGKVDALEKKLVSQVAVRAELDSRESEQVELELVYSVTDASWSPQYDVHVDTKNKKMKIHYWARVSQQTGESWKEAKVTVVSGKTSEVGKVPRQKQLLLHKRMNATEESEGMEAQRAVSVAVELDGRRTIHSLAGPQLQTLAEMDLDPALEYFCIPRQSLAVFVRVRALLRSAYCLLPGTVALYRDGSLVSRSEIGRTVLPKEDFVFPLGAELSARLEYAIREDRHDDAAKKKSQLIYEARINIKNKAKEGRLKVTVLEQVPKGPESASAPVKVHVNKPSLDKDGRPGGPGPRLNRFNHIEWNLDLGPDEAKTLDTKVVVEFPFGDEVVFG